MIDQQLNIRRLGLQPYQPIWTQMQELNAQRDENTIDEIWQLEHEPVFTQGYNGGAEHLLSTGDIPVIDVDRGGQVTYHGPGQSVVYLMIDLKRKKLGVKHLVEMMEQSVIALLADYGVEGYAKKDAPGVYVNNAKIASLGLRVRRGRTFHGLACNVNMDMEPFLRINPCGYAGMPMTQLSELVSNLDESEAHRKLVGHLVERVGYQQINELTTLSD